MNKYNDSKIYKIVDDGTGDVYYGSTIEKYISRRLQRHKSNYNVYLKTNKTYFTSYKILKNNNYHIELVENVNCDNRFQLHNRERYYIENNNCVNKNIPNRPIKEYHKEYYIVNIDKIRTANKEYYKNKKDKLNIRKKEYYKNNKDKINKRRIELYNYRNSWGGSQKTQNNLLSIDTTLFD